MKMEYHFEYWVSKDSECRRISIAHHRGAWWAKQVVIGRYAAVFIRQIESE